MGLRLTSDVMSAVRGRSEAGGETLTATIEQCLRSQLGLNAPAADGGQNLIGRVTELEQRVSQLEQRGGNRKGRRR